MKGNIQSRGPSTWRLFVNLGRDAQGRRRQKTLTVHGTKVQAQKRLREILADIDRGIAPPERILLRDWLQRWHTERTVSNRWTQATIERYECTYGAISFLTWVTSRSLNYARRRCGKLKPIW